VHHLRILALSRILSRTYLESLELVSFVECCMKRYHQDAWRAPESAEASLLESLHYLSQDLSQLIFTSNRMRNLSIWKFRSSYLSDMDSTCETDKTVEGCWPPPPSINQIVNTIK
jgi:hypothetical protein